MSDHTYYKKLNLPANPLKDSRAVSQMSITGVYDIVEPHAILTDEILSIFDSLELRVKMVALFGRMDGTSTKHDRLIHADLYKNNADVRGWSKLVAGVNWEIEGSHNVFYWYDMSKLDEHWPPVVGSGTSKYDLLNGIHYGQRGNHGVYPEQAVVLEHTTIDGPTLVRTDIPHSTLYHNPNTYRVGVSVRFFEEDFDHNWETVLAKFQPVFLK